MKVRKLTDYKDRHNLIEALDKGFTAKQEEGQSIPESETATFGLCSNCSRFQAVSTDVGILFAKCGEFERMLSQKTPVRKCTGFWQRGQLSIWDMQEIAYIIDDDKKIVGFIGEEEGE